MSDKTKLIHTIYVYLFSLVGLVLVIIAAVRFIDMGLKAWIFTEADSYIRYEIPRAVQITEDGKEIVDETSQEERDEAHTKQIRQQRQRDAAGALSQLIVGLPLYLYHWRLASRRREED